MSHTHHYTATVIWTGNRGTGTSGYREYDRQHRITIPGKTDIRASSDPVFRGDASRHNPEELLVAALSSCHMLWYLHLCAEAGIRVTAYSDAARGTMALTPDGGGQFVEVILHPQVLITADSDPEKAITLHEQAHHLCFIARSVRFPVRCVPGVRVE
ncbi:MAG: OsmC family protein [Saprospiraceae bacterium]|nr:OsmC family protein [Saprospiraceae bacterium]